MLDYSISTNVAGWFCSKKKNVLSCLIPSVGLLVFVYFLFHPQIRNLFLLFSSDEVVTAAQHLYEMVSFYFDDLGKPLFDDTITSRYSLLGEFYCLLVACFVL